jgi:hypothetical protein
MSAKQDVTQSGGYLRWADQGREDDSSLPLKSQPVEQWNDVCGDGRENQSIEGYGGREQQYDLSLSLAWLLKWSVMGSRVAM